MITEAAARRIGLNACIDKLGRDFVLAHKDTSTSAYGRNEGENNVFCFVGVDNRNTPYGKLVLDGHSEFPYRASCNVDLETGTTSFVECVCPKPTHGRFF